MASNYLGFSTAQWGKTKSFALTGIDLVKQDLLNHIWTIQGTRLMMPAFGTRIPILTFEPNDPITINIIKEDLTTVFNYDPRVNLIALNVMSIPANNTIIAAVDLFYVEYGVTELFQIEIPSQ